MKASLLIILVSIIAFACSSETSKDASIESKNPMVGTWKLVSGTLIEKGDTTIIDHTRNTSFIKIINDTHFSFLQHDLKKGKDSALFVAGGGTYRFKDNTYTEHLEYCSARDWEGNDFTFSVNIKNDTLTQSGVEKVESAGVERINIEKYVRAK